MFHHIRPLYFLRVRYPHFRVGIAIHLSVRVEFLHHDELLNTLSLSPSHILASNDRFGMDGKSIKE